MTIAKFPGTRVPPEVTLARMAEQIEQHRDVFTPESGCIVILYGADGQPMISFSNMDRDGLAFVAVYFDEFIRMLWRPMMRLGTLERLQQPSQKPYHPSSGGTIHEDGGDAQAQERPPEGPANWTPPQGPTDGA